MTCRVQISNHAAGQYIERINRNLLSIEDEKGRIALAKQMVSLLFVSAVYIEDSISRGIVFRNEIVKADMIIRNGVVVTVYPTAGEKIQRKSYAKSA